MIIYIQPKSLFQPLSSDTLYGAICSALSSLYEDFDEMLQLMKQSPPFLISSAFPFVGTKDIAHFLPKPIDRPQKLENLMDMEGMKKLKKVKYIHESIFNKWINGEVNEAYLARNITNYRIEDELIHPKELKLNFNIESLDIPRNSINRQSQLSDIFYSSGNYYKNVGFFFLVRFMNKENEKKYHDVLLGAVKFLRDRGFGGDVSAGKGHFELIDFTDKEILQQPENGNRFISLSSYHPAQDEINAYKEKKGLLYDIFTKRGRGSDGRNRKQVRFFTEGSTFPELNKEIYGEAIPVEKEAVEFGYAYNVRMR